MIALQAVLVAMLTLLVTSGGAQVVAPVTDGAPAVTTLPEDPLVAPDDTGALQPVGRFVPFQPDPPDAGHLDWSPLVRPIAEPFFVMFTNPVNDGEIIEGDALRVTWRAGGPVATVRMYYEYENCRLAGRFRGSVGKVIAGTKLPNTGEHTWTIPWMDTYRLRLRIAAYDADGGLIDHEEIGLQYRPKELRDLPPTAIGILKSRQRLYYFEGGKIKRMHIVSTAMPGYWTPLMEPGSYDRRRGSMGQVFSKSGNAWSRRYECWMPYWMAITSSGSHGIHATSSPFYHRLGRPASHGCVRQHRADARKLFKLVKMGTPVYVR
jgi:hypothetical protein